VAQEQVISDSTNDRHV